MVRFTEDPAQSYLIARIKTNSRRPFKDLEEAITTLSRALGRQNEDMLADQAYQKLIIAPDKSFASFNTAFFLLTNQANISKDVRERDLWFKVTRKLRTTLAPTRFQYKDLSSLSEALFNTDVNLRFEEEQLREERRTRRPSPKAPGTASLKPHRLSNGRFMPAVERGATPALADRQRSKTPAATSDLSMVQCYNCGKLGHMSRNCSEPKKTVAELKEIYSSD